jgi:hypothetical protein
MLVTTQVNQEKLNLLQDEVRQTYTRRLNLKSQEIMYNCTTAM